jgi:integrase
MPNRINFTQLAVERLTPRPSGRVTYWDRNLPGFGLRIASPRPGSREGRKTWIAMGRVDGKPVMVTLGTLAQVPKVDKAREVARAALLKMRGGTSPLEERKAEKAQKEAAAKAVTAAEREAAEGRFALVAARFLDERSKEEGWAPAYEYEFRRIVKRDVLPRWGEKPIRAITRADVTDLIDHKAEHRGRARKGETRGAGVQANRTLTRLRTLFGWAAAEGLIAVDPTAGVRRRFKEEARDRVLSDAEIVSVWRAAESTPWPYGPIFKLMLLTAQREGEIAGMSWRELDLDNCTWNLPGERTKNGKPHIVHLSAPAMEVIRDLPRIGEMVFPTRNGTQLLSFSAAKLRLDALVEAESDWVLHDLRRTGATIMARLGIAPHIADRVLNHVDGAISGVARIYNRFQYVDERKAALDTLGRFVESLVKPGANVIPLRA